MSITLRFFVNENHTLNRLKLIRLLAKFSFYLDICQVFHALRVINYPT